MKYILNAEAGSFTHAGDSIKIKIESSAFFAKKRDDCVQLLSKENPSELDIMEFMLNLHLVLEIGVNAFFRNYFQHISCIDEIKDTHVIDEISFIDKVKFFLVSNNFTFQSGDDRKIANKKSTALISDIMVFSSIRNKIIHGHSVSESNQVKSKLKKQLTPAYTNDFIEKYKEIILSLNYFIDRMDSSINRQQIALFQKNWLSVDFLGIKSFATA